MNAVIVFFVLSSGVSVCFELCCGRRATKSPLLFCNKCVCTRLAVAVPCAATHWRRRVIDLARTASSGTLFSGMGAEASTQKNGTDVVRKKQPPRGSIAYKRLQKQRQRAKAEASAFNEEEKSVVKRLTTALQSLDAEAAGGLPWVECEDLKNLAESGEVVISVAPGDGSGSGDSRRRDNAGGRGGGGGSGNGRGRARSASGSTSGGEAKSGGTPVKTTINVPRQLYRDDRAENAVLRAQNKTLLGEVRVVCCCNRCSMVGAHHNEQKNRQHEGQHVTDNRNPCPRAVGVCLRVCMLAVFVRPRRYADCERRSSL